MSSSLPSPMILLACVLVAAPCALAADPQPTTPAIVSDTAAPPPAARAASAEVFRPAPLPDEGLGAPSTQVASDEPNLRPDLLRLPERDADVLGDSSAEYQRAGRTAPAGGMSLSIPVQ